MEGANDKTKINVKDDDELPEWARQNTFVDNHLSLSQSLSIDSPPRTRLRSSRVSSATSPPPIARPSFPFRRCFLNADAIHGIAQLEREGIGKDGNDKAVSDQEREREKEKGKRGWTFRRTDNLRAGLSNFVHTPTPIKQPATHTYLLPSTQPPYNCRVGNPFILDDNYTCAFTQWFHPLRLSIHCFLISKSLTNSGTDLPLILDAPLVNVERSRMGDALFCLDGLILLWKNREGNDKATQPSSENMRSIR